MAKDREIVCLHYKYEGECDLGKEASFRGLCQTCPQYRKLAGAKPARTDTRRSRLDRASRRERNE